MMSMPLTLSLRYQDDIHNACAQLPKLGLRYFVMSIVFNDGNRFVLSNLFHTQDACCVDKLHKEGDSLLPEKTLDIDHVFDENVTVFEQFNCMISDQNDLHHAYHLVRKCPECTFVFGAMNDHKVGHDPVMDKDIKHKFENFCVDFVGKFIAVIAQYHPLYINAFILNNHVYREAVIKGGYLSHRVLTEREKQCLILASQGKSTKEIAKILSISHYTVETYSKNIKEKMGCATMIEAALEGVLRGIVGVVNRWVVHDKQEEVIKKGKANRKSSRCRSQS